VEIVLHGGFLFVGLFDIGEDIEFLADAFDGRDVIPIETQGFESVPVEKG